MAEITKWVKKIWKNRTTEFPTRRTLMKEDGSSEIVTVTRNEGTVSEEGDAFDADTMNNLEERIDAGFAELNGKLQKDLLWTNPDSTKIFTEQTLNIDLNKYNWIMIDFKFTTNVNYFSTIIANIDEQYHIGHVIAHRIHYRGFTSAKNNIIFDNGVEVYQYNTVTSNPAVAIPYKIYGLI